MANTTPSQSISLGASLQEQLGDLQGAARTLNDEAKSAQREVREAQKEIRELEKRKKKGEDVNLDPAIRKLQSKEFEVEQKKQRATDLKVRAKEDAKLKSDISNRLGGFEKRASSQMYSVKDSLDFVSKKLTQTQSGLAKSVGISIAAVSSKITPGMISGVAKVAGPIGAAYVGASIGGKFVDLQHRFRDRGKQVAEIQGASADNIRRVVQGFITQSVPKEFTQNLNEMSTIAGKRAAEDINKQDLIKFDFGKALRQTPILGALFSGRSEKELRTEKRKSDLLNEQLALLGVKEKYGSPFADKNSISKLMESPEVRRAWTNYIEESSSRIIINRTGLGSELLGEEKFKFDLARGMQQRTVSAQEAKRAADKLRLEQNPDAVSENHIRSSRWAGLERQRVRRVMLPTTF